MVKLNMARIDCTLGVVVKGDSRLFISFMTGAARPGKPFLLHRVKECKRLIRQLNTRVFWLHVPREENGVADWLARKAAEVHREVVLS